MSTPKRGNQGWSTKGRAGRKPAVIEENVKQAILRAAKRNPGSLEKIWDKIFLEAESGSEKHIRILFEYYYGRPVENVKIESKAMSINITRTIITANGNNERIDIQSGS